MQIRTSFRHRLAMRSVQTVERLMRKVLALESLDSMDNLVQTNEGDLLKINVHEGQDLLFSFLHRGTPADLGVIRQILHGRDYETRRFPKHHAWLESAYSQIVQSGRKPLIIDAGANIGLGSLYLGRKYPEAQLVCVEPASSNFLLLNKNLAGTGARTLQAAIHSGAEFIEVLDPAKGEWGYSTHRSESHSQELLERVPCVRFEELAESGEEPFILKVDIEGGEKDEFYNKEFLSRFALIILELHDWLYPADKTSESFIRFAANSDFDFTHRGENIFLFNRKFTQVQSIPTN